MEAVIGAKVCKYDRDRISQANSQKNLRYVQRASRICGYSCCSH